MAGEGGSGMKATIWHNPKCGTSRKTLAILEETPGVKVEVIEYLQSPPNREKLASLYKSAGISPREGRSEEHTSELQSLMRISYAVFCLKKKKVTRQNKPTTITHTTRHTRDYTTRDQTNSQQ